MVSSTRWRAPVEPFVKRRARSAGASSPAAGSRFQRAKSSTGKTPKVTSGRPETPHKTKLTKTPSENKSTPSWTWRIMLVSPLHGGQPITVQRRGGDAYRAWSTAPFGSASNLVGVTLAGRAQPFRKRPCRASQGEGACPGTGAEHPQPARRRRHQRQRGEMDPLVRGRRITTRGDAGCCVSFLCR